MLVYSLFLWRGGGKMGCDVFTEKVECEKFSGAAMYGPTCFLWSPYVCVYSCVVL